MTKKPKPPERHFGWAPTPEHTICAPEGFLRQKLRTRRLFMDFKRNKHFFDKQFAKKTKIMMTVGIVLTAVALLLLVVGWYGPIFVWIMWEYGGTPLLVAGIVLIFFCIGRRVKESDVTDGIDALVKEVSDACAEKLKYPSDLDEKAIAFSGCTITAENAGSAVKLSGGEYISEELIVTYIYIAKNKLWCYEKRTSLTEDAATAEQSDIVFFDFDSARLEDEDIAGIKVHYFRLYNGDKVIFDVPVNSVDYYKEEFCGKIMHERKKLQH